MMNRSIFSDSIVYGAAFLLNAVSGLVVLPIYLKLLSPSEFGVLDTLIAVIGCASFVTSMGAHTGATRIYFDSAEVEVRRTLVSSVLFFLLGATVVSTLVLAIGHPLLESVFGRSVSNPRLLLLCLPLLPLQILSNFSEYILRCRRRSRALLLLAAGGSSLKLAASILLATQFGLKGALVASWVPFVLSSAAGVLLNREYIRPTFSLKAVRSALGFGLPLVTTTLSFSILGLVDRAVVARNHSSETLGLYSLATKFIFLYTAALAGLRQAWGPIAFERWNDSDFDLTYRHFVTSFAAVGVAVVASIAAFTQEGLRWFAPGSYAGGAVLVPWFLVGALMVDLLPCAGVRLMQSKKMGRYAVVVAVGVAVGCGLDFVLIPRLGLSGIAASFVLARAMIFVALASVARRRAASSIEWGKLLVMTATLMTTLTVAAAIPALSARVAGWVMTLLIVGLTYRASARQARAALGAAS